jgi:solute carrier family 25 S-adenosylmethionine transporter 26
MSDETRERNASSSTIAVASAFASLVTKSVLHPIDTLKCRLQSHEFHSLGSFRHRWQGHWRLRDWYRGLPPKLLLYPPYQAIYMTTYARVRELTSAEASRFGPRSSIIVSALAAEGLSCCIRVPMEVIKLRLQSSKTTTSLDAVRGLRKDGVRGTFRYILPQTILHDIPYSVIQWLLYEAISTRLKEHFERSDDRSPWYRALRFFAAGGVAGMITSFVTTPLDVVKTRAIVHSDGSFKAIWSTFRGMVMNERPRVFFRGAQPRIVWVGSNMALYFYVFETVKAVWS